MVQHTISFDTLAACRSLQAAGMGRRQAEAVATRLGDVVKAKHDRFVTRADLVDFEKRSRNIALGAAATQLLLTAGVLGLML